MNARAQTSPPSAQFLKVGVSFRPSDTLFPKGVSDYVRYAELAERHGFDDFDAADHLLVDARSGEDYPGGTFRWHAGTTWPDPLIVLAACAARTRRIQLTTSVLIAPLRPAVLVAKMVATLDELSRGRVRLGLGTGWNRVEFDALDVPYSGRSARMEDAIGAMRALWTGEAATFQSGTVSFREVRALPRPARTVPILLGGGASAAVADRIARLADGWTPMAAQADELADGIALLHDAFERLGRPRSKLTVRTPMSEVVLVPAVRERDASALRAEMSRLQRLGVTEVDLWVSSCVDAPEDVDETLAWLSAALAMRGR
ncbi:TIGR03619 family F420-dependent LLM class oxidoreductase [Agrococcus baldri]|uniref:Luciferase-like domain-containing protein n=1 Tax=Agrococcus baldri TaxID=153730 RepID=A0AA87RB71_9MICO|nr:TIGR03619 family F420-dependent LLM class oxidoreductase [Agrococcus baldri]GEK79641.1 hypothetical protein ABA31_09920 [Agrococcus baldri]